jgi:primosomal protein N'
VSQEQQLRSRLRHLPPLDESRLWGVQAHAIRNLEASFAKANPRALVQMATGSGKTFAAVISRQRWSSSRRLLRAWPLVRSPESDEFSGAGGSPVREAAVRSTALTAQPEIDRSDSRREFVLRDPR